MRNHNVKKLIQKSDHFYIIQLNDLALFLFGRFLKDQEEGLETKVDVMLYDQWFEDKDTMLPVEEIQNYLKDLAEDWSELPWDYLNPMLEGVKVDGTMGVVMVDFRSNKEVNPQFMLPLVRLREYMMRVAENKTFPWEDSTLKLGNRVLKLEDELEMVEYPLQSFLDAMELYAIYNWGVPGWQTASNRYHWLDTTTPLSKPKAEPEPPTKLIKADVLLKVGVEIEVPADSGPDYIEGHLAELAMETLENSSSDTHYVTEVQYKDGTNPY